ncbi:MAG: EamA family transporter [Acidimicrobiales bacterium]
MPTHVVLAVAAAASWGASDFLGGVAGRRSSGQAVAFVSQMVGLFALAAAALFVAGSPTAGDLAWGLGAGVGGAAGVALLYHGLAIGQMSVVAPVTAVGGAAIPVVFGLVTGERPPVAALAGVGLALAAVAVLCVSPPHEDGRTESAGSAGGPVAVRRRDTLQAGLVAGLLSGAGFGVFFICVERAGSGAGLWPLVAARVSSVTVLGVVVAATGGLVLSRRDGPLIVVVGLLDVLANVGYLLATRRGPLSIVALLASLYPAVTVLMARFLLGERLSTAQRAGLAAAGAAVGIIALSS